MENPTVSFFWTVSQTSCMGRNRTNCIACANWGSFVYDDWQQWHKGSLSYMINFLLFLPPKESHWYLSFLHGKGRIYPWKRSRKVGSLFDLLFNLQDSNPPSNSVFSTSWLSSKLHISFCFHVHYTSPPSLCALLQ